jgi:hypothetical protein
MGSSGRDFAGGLGMKKVYEKPTLVLRGRLGSITAANAPVGFSNPPLG